MFSVFSWGETKTRGCTIDGRALLSYLGTSDTATANGL